MLLEAAEIHADSSLAILKVDCRPSELLQPNTCLIGHKWSRTEALMDHNVHLEAFPWWAFEQGLYENLLATKNWSDVGCQRKDECFTLRILWHWRSNCIFLWCVYTDYSAARECEYKFLSGNTASLSKSLLPVCLSVCLQFKYIYLIVTTAKNTVDVRYLLYRHMQNIKSVST
jgi:hypothetical protein